MLPSLPVSILYGIANLYGFMWQTFLKCTTFLHSAHIFPYAGHCLSWWSSPQYLHSCHCVAQFTGALALLSLALSDTLILSNCLDSGNESSTITWALCASSLLATPPCLHLLCSHHYFWPYILLLFPQEYACC